MKKLYNTQEEITTKIKGILLELFPNIRKNQLKIIPFIIFGMIIAESNIASKIAVKLKDFFKINFLIPMIFMTLSLEKLLALLNLNTLIKEFILLLIICFLIIIMLFS